jgi:hypothetical protein
VSGGGHRWGRSFRCRRAQAHAVEGRRLAALEKEGIEAGGNGEGRSWRFAATERRGCVRLEGDTNG